MSIIGTLEIQMMADMARLRADMNDAKSAVGGAMEDITKVVDVAKAALVAFAGVSSVAAFANMIKGAIDATGALHDMAIQTGASEAALGEFRKMGAYTETSVDTIAGAMNKLAKNMVGASEDSKGAGIAIQALGLNFDDFKKLNPEQQMIAVASAMGNFADGADKGAAAQALFGKEGARLLPFLKDLGDSAEEVTAKLTDQQIELKKTQAAMADAFGDNLIQIRKEADGWKKDLATGMTPALYEASQAFLDVSKETGGFKDEIARLSKDGSITEWTRMAITGLTYVMDAFSGLITVVKSAGLIIGATMALIGDAFMGTMTAIGQVAKGEFSAALDTMTASANRQKTMVRELGVDLDATWGQQTLGSKLRARMEDIKGVGLASEASKPQLDVSGALAKTEAARVSEAAAQKAQEAAAKTLATELKKQEDQYAKLGASIDGKISSMQQELDTGTKLTEADKIENQLLADLANSTRIMTDAQLENIIAKINQLRAVENISAEEKRYLELSKQSTAENYKALESLTQKTDKLNDNTRAAEQTRLEAEAMLPLQIGLNTKTGEMTQALGDLRVARILDQAAAEDSIAKLFEESGVSADVVQAHKDLADAYRASADEAAKGTHLAVARETATEWNKTTKSISDGLTNAFIDGLSNGKSLFVTFRDYIENLFMDMVLRPSVNLVMQPFADALNGVINSALSNLTGGILGNTGGSAAGSAAGGAATGSAGSIAATIAADATTIGSVVSGTMGVANGAATIAANAGLAGGGIDGLMAATGAFGTAAEIGAAVEVGSAISAGTVVATDLGFLGAEAAGLSEIGAAAGAAELGLADALSLIPGWGWALGGALLLASIFGGGEYKGTDQINTGNADMSFDPQGNMLDYNTYFGGSTTETDDFIKAMEAEYLHEARTLGIAPMQTKFAYGSNVTRDGDKAYALGGWAGAEGFYQPETALTDAAVQDSASRAIFAALKGSAQTQSQLDAVKAMYPAYEHGGLFGGGIRLVGERGPELEVTGPSRIFDANTTASMLRSGGANDSELLNEMRMLRMEVISLRVQAQRTANATNGQPEAPMIVQVDA